MTSDTPLKKRISSINDNQLNPLKEFDHIILSSGREIIDNDFDAVFVHTFDGKLLEVNKTACQRLGYSRGELVNKEREELMALNLVGSMPEYIELVKRDGALTFESVSVTESGELMPVEVRTKIINYQGEEAVLTFSRDLTEQRAKEGAMINKLEVLHKHAINLSKLYSLESIAEYSLDVIEELLGRGKVSIGVVVGDRLRFLFSRDFPTEKPLSLSLEGEGITVRAVRTGETQLVDDTRRDPDYIPSSEYPNCLSELDVPIKFNGKVVAVINLNISEANAFTEQERKIVEILSEHISSAIARIQLLQNENKSD